MIFKRYNFVLFSTLPCHFSPSQWAFLCSFLKITWMKNLSSKLTVAMSIMENRKKRELTTKIREKYKNYWNINCPPKTSVISSTQCNVEAHKESASLHLSLLPSEYSIRIQLWLLHIFDLNVKVEKGNFK